MKIVIKLCVERDLGNLIHLSKELDYKNLPYEHSLSYLKEILKSKNDFLWFAEVDSQAVGWLHLFRSIRPASEPFMEIGGMIVSSQFRRKGIGTKLVEQALQKSREEGIKLRVRCNMTRTDTHFFYKKIGFTPIKSQQVFDIKK